MNEKEHREEEGGSKISLARARELLGDNAISDEDLKKVIENLNIFCGIVYDIYKKIKRDRESDRFNEDTENGEENKGFDYKDAA